MRALVASLALIFAPPAMAQSGQQPCFTEDSLASAQAVLTERLQWRTIHPPELSGRVVLDCTQQGDATIACAILEETDSPYRLGEAALAYAAELRTCSAAPQRFYRSFNFMTADDPG